MCDGKQEGRLGAKNKRTATEEPAFQLFIPLDRDVFHRRVSAVFCNTVILTLSLSARVD